MTGKRKWGFWFTSMPFSSQTISHSVLGIKRTEANAFATWATECNMTQTEFANGND